MVTMGGNWLSWEETDQRQSSYRTLGEGTNRGGRGG